MSLRRRLTLSLITILILFAINVGTHFWGSFARNESMEAYRNSVTAARLSTEVEGLLNDQRQTILVLSTIRANAGDQLDDDETKQAWKQIDDIRLRIQQLGKLSHDVTRLHYDRLDASSNVLLEEWSRFYQNYNNPDHLSTVDDPAPYIAASQRLKELEQRQAFIATQRANIIDRTIALTDRITVIGFIASIFLTAMLGFFPRPLHQSLTQAPQTRHRAIRQRRSELPHRQHQRQSANWGIWLTHFNDMSDKLRNAMYDVSKARDAADDASAAKSIFLANVVP